MFLDRFIELVGASVCHQLPSRTLHLGDIFLPTCARCSSIYIGFLITAIFLFAVFRKKESSLPPLYIMIVLILFILSTIVDGAVSYLTEFSTNNIVRTVTGFLCGASIMVIIFPIFNFEYYRKSSEERVFRKPVSFVFFLILLALFIFLSFLDFRALGIFFYYLDFISIIFTFYFINTVLILLIPVFSRKADKIFSKFLIIPSLISIALTALELFISYRLHMFLNSL